MRLTIAENRIFFMGSSPPCDCIMDFFYRRIVAGMLQDDESTVTGKGWEIGVRGNWGQVFTV
jgi:hypothetical protein